MGRFALGVVVALFVVFLLSSLPVYFPPPAGESAMRSFTSYDELVKFLSNLPRGWYVKSVIALPKAGVDKTGASPAARYSGTNVQVAGVDEADLVKTDGRYVYFASGSRVYLIEAYPVESARVLSVLETEGGVVGLFKNGDRLVVISLTHVPWVLRDGGFMVPFLPEVEVRVYDVADIRSPREIRSVEVNGSYVSSRMVGGYVYFVVAQGIVYKDDKPLLPRVVVDGEVTEVPASKVYYSAVEDGRGYFYTLVIALDLADATQGPSVVAMLTGFSTSVYVSHGSIYLAVPKPDSGGVETVIHRVGFNGLEVKPAASGVVAGGVVNQFSMDEYRGFFRIATTINPRGGEDMSSSIYILDMNLNKVGQLDNLAPGERIYSVRFMQDKAFVVTFRQVDPLFVIELKDPEQPRILGELKIPGFSTYLHPFGEDYLIGLGRETEVDADTGAVVVEGLKLSLFNISDYTKPREVHKLVIKGPYVDSEALRDHRAFLLDSDNRLLIIPVIMQAGAEADSITTTEPLRGRFFQGVLVFRIDPEDGIEVVGNVTHLAGDEQTLGRSYVIKRSLYIDDILYTFSGRKMMMHSLATLDKIGELTLS